MGVSYNATRILIGIYLAIRNAKVEGGDISQKGPALIAAAPHTYWADPAILSWAIERSSLRTMRMVLIADFLGLKKELLVDLPDLVKPLVLSAPMRRFIAKTIINAFDPIPVRRNTKDRSFREELDKAILSGCLVGLFVEESDKYNDLSRIKSGAASIAMKHPDLKVYPAGILNANPALGFWSLKVRIGKPFTVNQLRSLNPKLTKNEITKHLADNLADLIADK